MVKGLWHEGEHMPYDQLIVGSNPTNLVIFFHPRSVESLRRGATGLYEAKPQASNSSLEAFGSFL